ncbi:MAG: hypothetical protein PQJ50_08385 [Spirochaetales bacterium]|nr:hypothetical protein [Spirochaetales bacterium]
MYSATVVYEFKEESFDKACTIWRSEVLELARKQPGFVRMQFLTSPPRAMAIGTWKDESFAQAFMQTGVFKNLLEKLTPLLAAEPRPRVWDLRYFAEFE